MLSLELVTSPSKKNLKLFSGHNLLPQRRMKIKPAHMKPKGEVEKSFKQWLYKAT
jgi:hypothetical protein